MFWLIGSLESIRRGRGEEVIITAQRWDYSIQVVPKAGSGRARGTSIGPTCRIGGRLERPAPKTRFPTPSPSGYLVHMVFSPPVQRLALAMASTLVALGGGWLVLKALSDEGATVEFVDDADAFRAELARRAESGEAVVIADAAELGQDFARRLQEDLTEADLFTLFPQLKRKSLRLRPGVHFGLLPNKRWHREFDEHPQGGFLRSTNALGMREDSEAGEAAVDLCVLVMGDSHTEGVCANSESLANRFEHRLRVERPDDLIEVWNVAVGGFTPANYLGTLEAYGQLQPHALVLVFYGVNDFRESLAPWRYLYRRPPCEPSNVDTSVLMEGGKPGIALLGQEIYQALGFSADPDAGNDALRLARGL